jgi:hypothetical protein
LLILTVEFSFHYYLVNFYYRHIQFPVATKSHSDTLRSQSENKLPIVRTTCTLDTIKRDASSLRHITLFMRDRHGIDRMTPPFVLILILMFYCTSGIRTMSIQNESDHTQMDELRQTVVDLSTKIQVLNETIRKGKIDLITNCCTMMLFSLCCRSRDRMVGLF